MLGRVNRSPIFQAVSELLKLRAFYQLRPINLPINLVKGLLGNSSEFDKKKRAELYPKNGTEFVSSNHLNPHKSLYSEEHAGIPQSGSSTAFPATQASGEKISLKNEML